MIPGLLPVKVGPPGLAAFPASWESLTWRRELGWRDQDESHHQLSHVGWGGGASRVVTLPRAQGAIHHECPSSPKTEDEQSLVGSWENKEGFCPALLGPPPTSPLHAPQLDHCLGEP